MKDINSDINAIEQALYNYSDKSKCEDERRYAVLIPLLELSGRTEVLFEVRASDLRRQPGEICFPGGSTENDETPEQTAVRETSEELLIDQSSINVIHLMNEMSIYSGGVITPVVGTISGYDCSYSSDEVDHVFTLPLEYLMDAEPEFYSVGTRSVPGQDFPFERIPGGRDYPWEGRNREICFYKYEDYDIWGITAAIVYRFIGALKAGGYDTQL